MRSSETTRRFVGQLFEAVYLYDATVMAVALHVRSHHRYSASRYRPISAVQGRNECSHLIIVEAGGRHLVASLLRDAKAGLGS